MLSGALKSAETRSTLGLLTLTGLKGVGSVLAERLADHFDSFEAVIEADPVDLRKKVPAFLVETLQRGPDLSKAYSQAKFNLDKAATLKVRVVSIYDPDYPVALKALPDRPPVIYIKGKTPPPRSVACIGTREPSDFGEIVAERIVEKLVSANWAIVSGLALGIDTSSHTAALRFGGQTIAVMAGGLDSIYPKQNTKLADEIVERNGGLISEQPFGMPPSPRNLVQRDRLQSGLSVATFVMQTDIKGGSMHTVRFTLMQGRGLFAPVPQGRHAEEPKSRGILALTQDSALRFAEAIQAEGDYRRLLSRLGSQPTAIPLASREDYESMLNALEARLQLGPTPSTGKGRGKENQLSMI